MHSSSTKSQTKRQERHLMQSLMQRRERMTPGHHAPVWVTKFWKGVAS